MLSIGRNRYSKKAVILKEGDNKIEIVLRTVTENAQIFYIEFFKKVPPTAKYVDGYKPYMFYGKASSLRDAVKSAKNTLERLK